MGGRVPAPSSRWTTQGPVTLVVTDRSQVPPGHALVDVVGAALEAGAHGVLVRERDLPREEREELLRAVADLCALSGAALLVSGLAPHGIGASGIHLARDEPVPYLRRDRPSPDLLVGRSCHDLPELLRACRDRLDHVTLSPVAATASKPGYGPALGVAGLRALLAALEDQPFPRPRVLALGGVDPANAARWVEAGADGVAVMGEVMRSTDPAETVCRVLRALEAAPRAVVRSPARGSR